MISLEKATLAQIVNELRSRRNLTFALIVLISGSESNSGIFASPDCAALDMVRVLIAGAQDIMDRLANDLEPGESKAKSGSETSAPDAATLRIFPGQKFRKPTSQQVEPDKSKATEKGQ